MDGERSKLWGRDREYFPRVIVRESQCQCEDISTCRCKEVLKA